MYAHQRETTVSNSDSLHLRPFSKMGTSLKGNNLLPEGAYSFLLEQFLEVWKTTFTGANRGVLEMGFICIKVWGRFADFISFSLNIP